MHLNMHFLVSNVKDVIFIIKLCGSGHPNLYKFINILKREESLVSIKYFRAISGYEADKRKKKDIEKDLAIETLIKEVEDDKIDLIEYVSEVSKLFHFRINKKKQTK